MKTINNFIIERLRLNDESKIRKFNIKDAKDGDIITIQLKEGNKKIYIFRSIEKTPSNMGYEGIKMYCFYDNEEGHFFIIPKNSDNIMGYLKDYEDPNVLTYWKSTDKEKRIFFDAMKEKGYKWNANKKQLVKL